MSKLLQRLRDASRSGVYRTGNPAAVLEATRGADLDVVTIEGGGKEKLLQNIARALDFPRWFGGNWDALEDSLGDLSWREGAGHILLFTTYPAGGELGVLIDVLRSVAEYWAGRGKPFFAVFIDAQRKLELPDLYRAA
ncbi:MAG TPA: barstar family protein [Burkholderiales bacterium]|nr:barstar family protein [Burkholderiales bacterium]